MKLLPVAAAAALLAALPALAAQPDSVDDLTLEQLSVIQVTSVSKRPESIADAPSSIYVLTANDIRRSGATTLPEALRLAPNLQVARVDARNYAVTARGFNNPFENKLLVLIDGRIVYSPLFSGVYWDAQDLVLDDIERIEVISGPGATLWGANAVNGVINIISKSAGLTQGPMVKLIAGEHEHTAVARIGAAISGSGHYRLYAKHVANDDTRNAAGGVVPTGWQRKQAGFRTDWGNSAQNATISGDTYQASLHQRGTRDIEIAGTNLLGRFNHVLPGGSQLSLLGYWDQTRRDQPGAFVERLNSFHLQAQHAIESGGHQLVWGGSYRLARDQVVNDRAFAFLPGRFDMRWADIFVQDEYALSDTLRVTGGLKFEKNNYTGWEFLPTVRLAWKPEANTMVWGAASRAVRAPSRIDRDLYSPPAPNVVNGVPQFALAGGPDFKSEIATVFEAGYRRQFSAALSASVTVFRADYDRLRTLEPNPKGAGSVFLNRASGRTRGIEMWGAWQVLPAWRLSGGLVSQRVSTILDPGSKDSTGTTGLATADPDSYWSLRSNFELRPGHELDFTLRHVGRLPRPVVPAYTAIDVRYGFKITPALDLSLIGQNLGDARHPEFGAAPGRSEYERALLVRLVWRP
jgi:iron complex outermembrane receptor protein